MVRDNSGHGAIARRRGMRGEDLSAAAPRVASLTPRKRIDSAHAIGEAGLSYLAIAGYSRAQVADLESRTSVVDRAKALKWVWGLQTDKGRDRGLAVRGCGRLFACLIDGVPGVRPRFCRDRACPVCMAKRARKYAGELRSACDFRTRELAKGTKTDRLLFVTLTQKKGHATHEGASAAIDRILSAWRFLTNKKSPLGPAFADICAGGVRSVEIVWSGRGSTSKGGHKAAYSGWHAHIHAVLELAPGVLLSEFQRELPGLWSQASLGAKGCGINVQRLNVDRVGQIAKYVTKPFETPEKRARELFKAVHARRMIDGFGSWRKWRAEFVRAEERPAQVIDWAEGSVAELGRRWRRYEQKNSGAAYSSVHFVRLGWTRGEPTEEHPLGEARRTKTLVRTIDTRHLMEELRLDSAQLLSIVDGEPIPTPRLAGAA